MTDEQIAEIHILAAELRQTLIGRRALAAAQAIGMVIGQTVRTDNLLEEFLEIVGANALASLCVSGDTTVH